MQPGKGMNGDTLYGLIWNNLQDKLSGRKQGTENHVCMKQNHV